MFLGIAKMFHWLELILCPDCWDSWENYMTAVRISGPWDQSYQLSVRRKQDRADAFLLTTNLKNLIVSKGVGLIPRSARSPEIGNDNMLQYSCLENSRDRGAWQTIVHEVSYPDRVTEHAHTQGKESGEDLLGYRFTKCLGNSDTVHLPHMR